MLEKLEKALKLSGKYPSLVKVRDIECLDERHGLYYVWAEFSEEYSMKLLVTVKEEKDGTVTLVEDD